VADGLGGHGIRRTPRLPLVVQPIADAVTATEGAPGGLRRPRVAPPLGELRVIHVRHDILTMLATGRIVGRIAPIQAPMEKSTRSCRTALGIVPSVDAAPIQMNGARLTAILARRRWRRNAALGHARLVVLAGNLHTLLGGAAALQALPFGPKRPLLAPRLTSHGHVTVHPQAPTEHASRERRALLVTPARGQTTPQVLLRKQLATLVAGGWLRGIAMGRDTMPERPPCARGASIRIDTCRDTTLVQFHGTTTTTLLTRRIGWPTVLGHTRRQGRACPLGTVLGRTALVETEAIEILGLGFTTLLTRRLRLDAVLVDAVREGSARKTLAALLIVPGGQATVQNLACATLATILARRLRLRLTMSTNAAPSGMTRLLGTLVGRPAERPALAIDCTGEQRATLTAGGRGIRGAQSFDAAIENPVTEGAATLLGRIRKIETSIVRCIRDQLAALVTRGATWVTVIHRTGIEDGVRPGVTILFASAGFPAVVERRFGPGPAFLDAHGSQVSRIGRLQCVRGPDGHQGHQHHRRRDEHSISQHFEPPSLGGPTTEYPAPPGPSLPSDVPSPCRAGQYINGTFSHLGIFSHLSRATLAVVPSAGGAYGDQ